MSTLRKFLGRLRDVKRVGDAHHKTWTARCPVHEDGQADELFVFGTVEPAFAITCERKCARELILEAAGMTLFDLRGRREDLVGPNLDKFDTTELANGKRLAYYHGDDIRFVVERGEWIIWDGVRYQPDTKKIHMRRRVESVLTKIQEEKKLAHDNEEGRLYERFWRTSSKVSGVKLMLEAAQGEEGIPVSANELDGKETSFYLAAKNGVIDLRTGNLIPGKRELLITHRVGPPDYDPDAKAPRWERFVSEIRGGNEDEVQFLQRWFGYCLTGETFEHKLCVFQGSGANGKGSLAHTIRSLLGSYAKMTPITTFAEQKAQRAREDLATLQTARMVVASEPNREMVVDESIVKQVAGEDPITCEFKFKSLFTYDPQFKVTILTNPLPKIRGTDHGIWRRIIFVPFGQTFPISKTNQLVHELAKEQQGILRWLVEGCIAWQKHGLMVPKTIEAATSAYRNSQDPLAGFLEDCCTFKELVGLPERWLFTAYKKWAEDAHEFSFRDIRRFRSVLAERKGIRVANVDGRNLIYGLVIKPAAAQDLPLSAREREHLEQLVRHAQAEDADADAPYL